MDYLSIIFWGWNLIVMGIYGIDKLLAKLHKKRISELTLLSCALLCGGVGAMFGMVLFNHKTAKMKFRILVPFIIIAETLGLYWLRMNL